MAELLSPGELEALRLTLRVAAWNLIVGLPLAVAIAWLLARREFWGKELLNALVHLPLILPPVVTGYILLILLGRRGPLGELLESWFGVVVAFRWTGAAIAATVMSFPVMVRPIRLSIEAIDQRLEAAAGTLGASPLAVFATVTLPLAMPGIVAGGILGFAKGMGEFGATITFVSNIPGETRTLALAIYTLTQVPGGELGAVRLTLIAVAVSLAALLAAELLGRYFARRIAA